MPFISMNSRTALQLVCKRMQGDAFKGLYRGFMQLCTQLKQLDLHAAHSATLPHANQVQLDYKLPEACERLCMCRYDAFNVYTYM